MIIVIMLYNNYIIGAAAFWLVISGPKVSAPVPYYKAIILQSAG